MFSNSPSVVCNGTSLRMTSYSFDISQRALFVESCSDHTVDRDVGYVRAHAPKTKKPRMTVQDLGESFVPQPEKCMMVLSAHCLSIELSRHSRSLT
jgi:hypothetical protein